MQISANSRIYTFFPPAENQIRDSAEIRRFRQIQPFCYSVICIYIRNDDFLKFPYKIAFLPNNYGKVFLS